MNRMNTYRRIATEGECLGPGGKILVLMVGLPRAGKTTRARQISVERGAPIVSPDEIRFALHGERFNPEREPEVWNIARVMVDALFRAGHHIVIVDATNNTEKRRDAWIAPGRQIVCEYVDTPAAECIRRARIECDETIVPVIQRMDAEADWKRGEGPRVGPAVLLEKGGDV